MGYTPSMDSRDEFDSGESASQPREARPIGDSPIVPPPVVARPFSVDYAREARPVVSAEWDAPPFPPINQAPMPALLDLIAVIALMVAFAIYSFEYELSERIAERVPSIGALGWVFANGLVALSSIMLFMALRGQSIAALGLCRSPWRRLLPVIIAAAPAAWVAGIACNIAYAIVQLLRGVSMESMMRHRLDFISVISEIDMRWVAPLSIFVGIYEEIFFRGFIMGRLASITRSRTAAVIVSSLLFGAVHFTQGWLGIFQTTCLGAVLALAAVKGRSLWAAILAHATIDGVSLAISVILRSDIANVLQELTTTQAGS